MKQSVKKWFVASAVAAALLAVPAQASPPSEGGWGGWFGWFSGWVERVERWVGNVTEQRPAQDPPGQISTPPGRGDGKIGPVRDPDGQPAPPDPNTGPSSGS